MASSNGKESSKITASMDSLKLSSKNTSVGSSKRPSSESVLSRKDKECLQMQECKKKLLAMEPQIIIRDENVVLRSPPQKKIVMPPTINPEELAASTPTQRNWRGILIALLVIAAVLGLIVFSIALLTPAGDGGRVKGRRPTLNDVLAEHYKPFNGTWLTDEELVFRDRWGGLTLFNVRNYTTRLLMNNSTFRELNAVDFKVSADLKFVLLISDVRRGWRHARLARYHVYDVITRNKIPISPVEDDRSAPLLQYAEWSPVGSSLVFVHDNDIYYKPRILKTLVCRITNTGIPGVIFNGVPDFLYETEILRLDRALWFSPDGQTLLYVTYNDSLVQQHKYPWYGLDQQEPPAYPTIKTLRYPKVNTNNPVVTVYVVSLKTPKFLFPHAIQFTSQIDKSWYVRWTSWLSEKQVGVLLLNRPQNVSIISICSAVHYNCQDIFRDESDGTRWSGLGADPVEECGWCGGGALVGGPAGVFTSAPITDQGGIWRHAVQLTTETRITLTQGSFEITQLVGWDERRRLLYVIGTAPEKAGERHLYRVSVPADGSWPPPPHCLTCTQDQPPDAVHLTTEPPVDELEYENSTSSLPAWPTSTVLPHISHENDTLPSLCLYNRVIFSKNFSYYVQECLGPGPPVTFLCSANGVRRSVLWDGQPLRQKFAALATPQFKVFRVEVQAHREARVRLLLPPGLRETDDLPLPLVLHVSAEPGGQLVTERWEPNWGWYLASARNFIVAEIDARGSGGQGEELRTEIYQKMLSVDVEDQIAVLSYLRDNLKMVDGSRVGLWGRGYGGGVAAAAAAGDARNVTRCLAAVAPLADLRRHNSYWTERYGGAAAGGAGGAVWRRAGNLPPRRVLLAHATADERAPPDHALALARALVRAQALYTHQIYPDEGHYFERSYMHLHKTMEQFFDECFGPVELADWDAGGVGGLFPFRD
ncbi:inactive dipeptidyl peptidase 10 isoform X1 [Papilio machaon]|uniref:inactive dipeptidyl peptidase 10 isoform X1 n=1 Tax=Papilio machaon TaxID=76193 RepID=UPI001E664332|nr:inactive dipeptidyl peptidase 10 isoform X1 [Papilio machaon]